MKILSLDDGLIDGIKIIHFARFSDHRGYFTESFRSSQFEEFDFLKGKRIVQSNESYSRKNVIRGLHFQWNPYMGKLVRTLQGRMVDLFLDIRKGSPSFGKAGMYEMVSKPEMEKGTWIWIPPGFAHGNYFTEDTEIEYFCTGEYSPGCEAGISPLAEDIDWGLCDKGLKEEFDNLCKGDCLITEKDVEGFSLRDWQEDIKSDNFSFKDLP